MVERCNVSEQEQGDSFDNGVDWVAFGELRDRYNDVCEPWLTDADIYDEKGTPTVIGERSMIAQEAHAVSVYHLAGGFVVTDADLEADAARFEDGVIGHYVLLEG